MEGTQKASTPAVLDVEETTRRIAELYRRVLNLPEVEPGDDFFVLGGTSWTALELLELIGREFTLVVPVRTFYRATAVRELAREVHALAVKEQNAC
jgi:hypothetical protein